MDLLTSAKVATRSSVLALIAVAFIGCPLVRVTYSVRLTNPSDHAVTGLRAIVGNHLVVTDIPSIAPGATLVVRVSDRRRDSALWLARGDRRVGACGYVEGDTSFEATISGGIGEETARCDNDGRYAP